MREITELGKILRVARIHLNMSMRDMAKELGVTASFLSNVERGYKRVPPNFPDRLAEILKNYPEVDLKKLRGVCQISNGEIGIEWLHPQHKELLVRLANMPMNEFFEKKADLEAVVGVI